MKIQDCVGFNEVLCVKALNFISNCSGQISLSSDSFLLLFNTFTTSIIGTSNSLLLTVHCYVYSVGCFPILNGIYIQTYQKRLCNISDLTNLDSKFNSIQNYHATL